MDELIVKGTINIGWRNCEITERRAESKCLRRWDHTHLKKESPRPDRSNLRMKCDKEEHKANLRKGRQAKAKAQKKIVHINTNRSKNGDGMAQLH